MVEPISLLHWKYIRKQREQIVSFHGRNSLLGESPQLEDRSLFLLESGYRTEKVQHDFDRSLVQFLQQVCGGLLGLQVFL